MPCNGSSATDIASSRPADSRAARSGNREFFRKDGEGATRGKPAHKMGTCTAPAHSTGACALLFCCARRASKDRLGSIAPPLTKSAGLAQVVQISDSRALAHWPVVRIAGSRTVAHWPVAHIAGSRALAHCCRRQAMECFPPEHVPAEHDGMAPLCRRAGGDKPRPCREPPGIWA